MPQGWQRRQLIDDVSPMGSLPHRKTQPDGVRQPLRVVDGAGRDAAFLVKTTYCFVAPPAAVASRGARQADTASTNGRPPCRCASAPPRAHTGHPILATCEARERAPRVPIGQASVSGRIRRGRLRAGARLPRAGGEPWLNFIVYSFAKCCPQSMLAVGLSHRGTAPRGCPRGTFGDVLHL